MRLTTPGRLRLATVVLVAGMVVLGLVGATAATDRLDAARTVSRETAPLLVAAQDLYVAFADADAAASTAFLRAGLEPEALRSRYLEDVRAAGEHIAFIAGQPDLSEESQRAITTISEGLPVYTGRVESARANNRQGFPVGAAYLRQASAQMRDELLPAATAIYDEAARDLYAGYRRGTASSSTAAVVAVAVAVLLALLVTQVFVAVRTRRTLNPGLVTATVLVVVLGAWSVTVFASEQDSLDRSRRTGSDPLLVVSTARILALQSLSDENLDLIERGTETRYLEHFDSATHAIGGDGGLLEQAGTMLEGTGTGSGAAATRDRFDDYLSVHGEVRDLFDAGSYREAVELAVSGEAEDAAALDDAFAGQIAQARERLGVDAEDARATVDTLALIVVVLAALAGLLAVLGLQRRIREYR